MEYAGLTLRIVELTVENFCLTLGRLRGDPIQQAKERRNLLGKIHVDAGAGDITPGTVVAQLLQSLPHRLG